MINFNMFSAITVAGCLLNLPAYAYVDPGSGTLILQLLAAAGVGALFYFRQFRDKLKSLFTGRSTNKDGPNTRPPGDASA